ncbi:MAG: efflux RND transporter periplasmic adaptor subunit [Bacteroidota bacterium]
MSRSLAVLLLVVILLGAACAPAPSAAPTQALPSEQSTPLPPGTVTASAKVIPAQSSKLSLVIPGTVKELGVAEGATVQAGQTLLVLNTPELEFGVTEAEAAARAAEFRFQYWVPARHDRPPERRQLAEQQMIMVQKGLDTARALLAQATLAAPFDGTVVSLDVEPGELVQPGQTLMTLADLSRLQIETTDLSERDIPKVQVGQKADVYVEALGETLSGRVTATSPIAETLGGDVIYKVTIVLDSIPEQLRWGMTAEVHIQTQ